MTAEVDLLLATYEDALVIPVASVTQGDDGCFCWVKSGDRYVKKPILLGDGNDIFLVVEQGLVAGDEVALSPQTIVNEQGLESSDFGLDTAVSSEAGDHAKE